MIRPYLLDCLEYNLVKVTVIALETMRRRLPTTRVPPKGASEPPPTPPDIFILIILFAWGISGHTFEKIFSRYF